MSLQAILTLAIAAVGAGVALATGIKAYAEYLQHGIQRRAEMFFELRRRLQEPHFAEISELVDRALYGDSDAAKQLAEMPLREKREYVGLFEEVALAVEWRFVVPAVANYMFGYYARNCRDCPAFWYGLNPGTSYWAIFYEFCRRMDGMHASLETRVAAGHAWPLPSRRRLERLRSPTSLPRSAGRPD
jgi:hypothetical protein